MYNNLKIGIGLQVCRPHKLRNIIYHLSLIEDIINFNIEIVVDRNSNEIDEILKCTTIARTITGGIGNWTSKNLLIKKLLNRDSDIIILLEDDIEILKEGLFDYIVFSYMSSKNFIGYFKTNNEKQKMKFEKSFIENRIINNLNFNLLQDLNTSALLVLDRRIINRIGFFCNSFYEVGFHDYRERLYGAKLIEYFLVPSKIYEYMKVDDSIPSTISKKNSAIYWKQKFTTAVNWYRPYSDKPKLVL
ncbi:hypothetical protein GCM10011531_07130 [Aquaticitalea lipolytica]|uniref:Uncharacterized protein n=1 Tax=Aquaticitalea lipolytica TaxID=1247562 RepID=A0A8J2TN43_9FLAO|nr:hypothetical protein [Aquaticitalea lipolytica]GFZ79777.1 hypothetical protein GCM10011531_07130 [Aquaticitalea lipolytica]